jgi:hypothetical protein
VLVAAGVGVGVGVGVGLVGDVDGLGEVGVCDGQGDVGEEYLDVGFGDPDGFGRAECDGDDESGRGGMTPPGLPLSFEPDRFAPP